MIHDIKAVSLYSDIDSGTFPAPTRQLTCKALVRGQPYLLDVVGETILVEGTRPS